ncbi:hypothetical protein M569_07377, partial [Genlisea aurea]
DKYRLYTAPEIHNNRGWRSGSIPNYALVNSLFEQGRKNVWPDGSLEQRVEKLVKTWEMEMVHQPLEFKTIDPNRFVVVINGTKSFKLEEIVAVGGSYNMLFQTSLPPEQRIYDPDRVSGDESNAIFSTVFPRGFALEVVKVYSDRPVIAYQFRHFGYFEGEFMGHPATGELAEFYGMAVFTLDPEIEDSDVILKIEFFFDRGEFLAALTKG